MQIVERAKRWYLRRPRLSGLESVDTLRSRTLDFERIRQHVLSQGTDSRASFGDDYAHEGGLFLQQNSYEITALICLLRERGGIGHYLEIGSASGGTCRLLSELVGFQTVTSLDDGSHPRAVEQASNFAGVKGFKQFVGDSHSTAAEAFVREQLPGPIDVAFVDGDHSEEGVWADICLIKPYLAPRAWLILHDTVPCDGVQRAWLKVAYGGDFKPLAEFIGPSNAMGIGVAELR